MIFEKNAFKNMLEISNFENMTLKKKIIILRYF